MFILPLPLVLYSLLSTFWSENHWLALYSSFRLILWYFLYCSLVIYFVPRGTFRPSTKELENCSTWNIQTIYQRIGKLFHVEQFGRNFLNLKSLNRDFVPRGTFIVKKSVQLVHCSTWNNERVFFFGVIISASIQAFIGVVQFFSQSSIGFTFLRESIISAQQAGIAKVILLDYPLVRPYGLFPHPNVLAGFLGFSLVVTTVYGWMYYKDLFHVEQRSEKISIVPRGTIHENIKNTIPSMSVVWSKLFHVEQSAWFYRSSLFVQLFCFLLTFSKSAYLGLFLAFIYFVYRLFHVEQGGFFKKCFYLTINSKNKKLFHVEHGLYIAIVLFFISALFLSLDWRYYFVQPLNERVFIQKEFISIFFSVPLQGLGIGQFVYLMQNFFSEMLAPWQFQPIHNLLLLVVSELGMIGLIAIVVPIVVWNKLFKKNVPRGTSRVSMMPVLSTLLMMYLLTLSLFDHYLWHIQQGQILLWILLAFSFSLQTRVILSIDKT